MFRGCYMTTYRTITKLGSFVGAGETTRLGRPKFPQPPAISETIIQPSSTWGPFIDTILVLARGCACRSDIIIVGSIAVYEHHNWSPPLARHVGLTFDLMETLPAIHSAIHAILSLARAYCPELVARVSVGILPYGDILGHRDPRLDNAIKEIFANVQFGASHHHKSPVCVLCWRSISHPFTPGCFGPLATSSKATRSAVKLEGTVAGIRMPASSPER